MADDINKKISISIEIKDDGQRNVQLYKTAFENLRSSITNLDKDISNLNGSLDKLNLQTDKASSSNNKVKDTVVNLSETFKALPKFIELVTTSFESLEGAVSGGLTLLIAFAPEILKWVGNMIKGTTTLSALNKSLKDNKIIMNAVNGVRLQGTQNAQGELVQLKLLYNASQDHNLSLKERNNAISALQGLYPDYFGNLSAETILTGHAIKNYQNLAKAIVATARARAAEDILVKNQVRQLGNDDQLKKLQQETDSYEAKLKVAQKAYDKAASYQDNSASSLTGGGATINIGGGEINDLTEKISSNKKLINSLKTDSSILEKQNGVLSKSIAAEIEKNGIKVIANLNTVVNQGKKSLKSLKVRTGPVPDAKTDTPLSTTQKTEPTDPTLTDDDKEILSAKVNDAQTTADAIRQIEAHALSEKMDADDDARKKKAEKDKQAAQELKDLEIQTAQQVATAAFSMLTNSIKQQSDAKIAGLEKDKTKELSNSSLTSAQKLALEAKYKKQEDQEKVKAFKEEQKAPIAQAIINGALAVTKATSQTGVLSAFVIPGIIAETAIQIAQIAAQKPPAYAAGGLHYTSDGRGGLLPGYSRTDNTNAYLRSGEGVVVSEAMRDPWARNLVSAINVGFGGRDFSTTTTGRGYAVGGIFTDGGDANRYYNQPVNDQKNLANTIAYQMINNFPPVYVDVKDINNQQNILAQTINRVNL